MENNLHGIFSGSECPPHSRLVDYYLPKLTDEEMHRVEQHLVDCEMCSDELEGLSKMNDPLDLEGIVGEINEHTYPGRRKILGLRRNYAILAAAAVVVLLVGSVMVIRVVTSSRPEQMMTVNTAPSVSTQDMASKTTIPSQPPAAVEKEKAEPEPAAQDIRQEPSPVAGIVSEEAKAVEPEVVQESSDQPAISDNTVPADSGRQTRDQIAPAATARNAPAGEGVSVQKMATDAKGTELSGKQGSATLMDVAMEEFRAKNYTQAALFFSQVTANDTANREAVYHLALCYYYTGETKKAIRILKSIGRDTLNPFRIPATELLDKIRQEQKP